MIVSSMIPLVVNQLNHPAIQLAAPFALSKLTVAGPERPMGLYPTGRHATGHNLQVSVPAH